MNTRKTALAMGLMAPFLIATSANAAPEGWPVNGCQKYCEETYQPGGCEDFAMLSCEATISKAMQSGNFVAGRDCMMKNNDKCVKKDWAAADMCKSLCSDN